MALVESPESVNTPVLISEPVLAAWLGIETLTQASHVEEAPQPATRDDSFEAVCQRAQEQSELIGPQPAGFVEALPVPEPGTLVVLDVRWAATDPSQSHQAYFQGHIPGAVYVSMTGQLAGHGAPSAGRHPLPDPAKLTDAVRMLGINDGDTVVVYDDIGSQSAARAWWLFRHAGLDKVYVLDGGLKAWRNADRPLQAGDVLPTPGDAHLSWGKMPIIKTEDVQAFSEEGILVDARAHTRYNGEEEPLDPVGGHIPTALNLPSTVLTDDDGKFLSIEELRKIFDDAGIAGPKPVVAYCGSGVTASTLMLGLHLAGIDAALYPGSFSAWSNTPGAAIVTGEEPGEFPDISETGPLNPGNLGTD